MEVVAFLFLVSYIKLNKFLHWILDRNKFIKQSEIIVNSVSHIEVSVPDAEDLKI